MGAMQIIISFQFVTLAKKDNQSLLGHIIEFLTLFLEEIRPFLPKHKSLTLWRAKSKSPNMDFCIALLQELIMDITQAD